jgi:hypothetical protein
MAKGHRAINEIIIYHKARGHNKGPELVQQAFLRFFKNLSAFLAATSFSGATTVQRKHKKCLNNKNEGGANEETHAEAF